MENDLPEPALRLGAALAGQAVARLEDVIECSFDGIGVVDGTGTLLLVNSGYERITGLHREAVVGKNLADLVSQGIISEAPSLEAIRQKRSITAFQVVSTGAEVLITASPLLDDAGNVALVIGNIRDITELNRLKEENARYRDLSRRYESELQELRSRCRFRDQIVAQSREMQGVLDLALRAAQSSCNVLIMGETGVGKEVIARVIHMSSERVAGPFIQLNCAAIPPTLLESELFGYEPGAFSGAQRHGKPGLFEMANHGTLLLDEIGQLPLDLQAKMLRVLQDQAIYRVGGTRPVQLDVRILAATNEDLQSRAREGTFRSDLFYRLNVVPLVVPPLRRRPADIIPLALAFLRRCNGQYRTNKRIALETQRVLQEYSWPGNVRELENLIERLVVMTSEESIGAREVRMALGLSIAELEGNPAPEQLPSLPEACAAVEKDLLAKAMARYRTAREVARALDVSHPTVIKKARYYGLPAPWEAQRPGK